MDNQKTVELVLRAGGRELKSEGVVRVFDRAQGMQKGLMAGGVVFAIALLMLPIPIVHFGSPLVGFIGAPLVGFLVFKLYSRGRDLKADAKCPSCGAPLMVARGAESFPIDVFCSSCKTPVEVDAPALRA